MRFGNLLFDPKFRYASRTDGKTIQFTPVETAALALLTAHVGQILPRQRLLDATQRGEAEALERSVDLLINRLRGKLGASALATRDGRKRSMRTAPTAISAAHTTKTSVIPCA